MPANPRIGRWETGADGETTLIASHCRACGETSFPERAFCPRCRSQELAEARLAGPATLYSYTVVHQVPAGFTAPLVVGYVKLGGDVMVLGPIDAPADALAKGMPLVIREGVTSTESDGTPFVSYRFAAAEPGASAHA